MYLYLESVTTWLKSHTIAFLTAICIAVVICSPQIRALNTIGIQNFNGIYPVFSDDEVYYQARIKEVLDGHPNIGNPYLFEHKEDAFIMPPVAEWIMAGLVVLTGSSVGFVTNASDGLLAIINFLVLYSLFLLITQKKWLALLYSIIFFCLFLTTFGRPVSPQFNILFFLTGLLLILRPYFRHKRSDRVDLSAGVLTGINCFLSPYFFTSLLALYSILKLHEFISNRPIGFFRQVRFFLMGFLPFAVPYAILQWVSSHDPFYAEAVIRYGLLHSHIPGAFTNILIGLSIGTTILLSKKYIPKKQFEIALILVICIFALNWQNVLTGKSLQFSSHYLHTTILFTLLSIAIIHASHTFVLNRRAMLYLGTMMVTILLLINKQIDVFLGIVKIPHTPTELLTLQEEAQVFDWFNTNTATDSVVLSLGKNYDYLIPIYTHNKVYYNFYATLFSVSNKETEERWIIQKLFQEELELEQIRDEQRDFWGNRFIDSYQSQETRRKLYALLTNNTYVANEQISDAVIIPIQKKWQDLKKQPLKNSLGTYHVDYILINRQYPYFKYAQELIDSQDNIILLEEVNNNLIYQVK